MCRRGGGAFDLMRRQSNGGSTGHAQNDRDEQPWVLMPGKPEEKADHTPQNPSGEMIKISPTIKAELANLERLLSNAG